MAPQELVVVDGANGYIGCHLVRALRRQGRPVRCLVRKGIPPEETELLKSLGADVVAADLSAERDDAADRALEGAAAAVHLIGSVAPPRGVSFGDMHGGQTRRWIEACRKAGVGKAVLVTAVGAGTGAASGYRASKGEAEEALRASGLRHAILRPSLVVGRVFGRRDSKLVRRYIRFILGRPVVPLVGGGTSLVQPVFVEDLAAGLAALARPEGPASLTVEAGGPEVLTMRAFVERLMKTLSKRKKIVSLPVPLAKAVGLLCEVFQRTPTLSRDQVTLSLQDNVCKENGLPALLGGPLTPLDDALKTYLK